MHKLPQIQNTLRERPAEQKSRFDNDRGRRNQKTGRNCQRKALDLGSFSRIRQQTGGIDALPDQ